MNIEVSTGKRKRREDEPVRTEIVPQTTMHAGKYKLGFPI